MNIGLDFDGVIFDFEENLFVESELYDVELKKRGVKNGVKDYSELKFTKRYNWDDETKAVFASFIFDKVNSYSEFKPGASLVLKKLKEDGHKLIVISSRGFINDKEIIFAERKISDSSVKFDEVNFKVKDKLSICKEKDIDVMVDDLYDYCKKLSENGVPTVYFRDKVSKKLKESSTLYEAINWGHIYRIISEIQFEKNKVLEKVNIF